jgi:hypothetical protein
MLNRLHDSLRLRTSPTIFFGSALVIAAFVVLTGRFTGCCWLARFVRG